MIVKYDDDGRLSTAQNVEYLTPSKKEEEKRESLNLIYVLSMTTQLYITEQRNDVIV